MGTIISTGFPVLDLFFKIDTITALMRVLEKILVRLLISSYIIRKCTASSLETMIVARTCTKSSLQQVQVLLGLKHPRDSKARKISRSLT